MLYAIKYFYKIIGIYYLSLNISSIVKSKLLIISEYLYKLIRHKNSKTNVPNIKEIPIKIFRYTIKLRHFTDIHDKV